MVMKVKSYNPVAWHDGMLIESQHFQQSERSLIHYVDSRFSQVQNHYWGFSHLETNEDSIGLGKLSLRKAKGVMPDGTPFDIPLHEQNPLPLSLNSAKIGDVACLALKSVLSDGVEVDFSGDESFARFQTEQSEVSDYSAGLDDDTSPKSVVMMLGRLKFRLCWEKELRTDEVALPFARVLRKDAVHNASVVLDTNFIPPLLDVHANDRLRAVSEEIQSVLSLRLMGSSGIRFLSAGGDVADLISLLMEQAMSEYKMRFAHLSCYHPLPPSMLFLELIGLLGRISVLPGVDDEVRAQEFTYEHNRLGESFDPLIRCIRNALARIIETPIIPLSFENRDGQSYIQVINPDWKLHKIIFAFRANMQADRLRQLLPQQSKFGPIEYMQKLVDLQLPGARLNPLPNPPRQVPFYAHSVYFEVESTDPYWSQTMAGSAMALRIVGEFPGLSFDAWGLRESTVK